MQIRAATQIAQQPSGQVEDFSGPIVEVVVPSADFQF
jgi:hypothetical protein